MIYNKLPIILLTEIACLSKDDINCQIAQTILNQINTLSDCSITELAKQCNVANSSISRFCRKIGLSDFSELKELGLTNKFNFEVSSTSDNIETRIQDSAIQISTYINDVAESINHDDIHRIAKDVHRYKRVTVLGLLKASSAAINLQADCLMLGKIINTKLAYRDQISFLKEADQNDLIIVFSYTGTYFSEGTRTVGNRDKKPKIYIISGDNNDQSNQDFEWVRFASPQTQLAHPYQLIFISSLIAQEYQRLLFDPIS